MTLQNYNTTKTKTKEHFDSKNVVRSKIGSWFVKHPEYWTNPLSAYSIYRGFTRRLRILPDFIIIGSPKCGTTALYDYLIQHKNVFPALWKEIYFFDRYYPRGINWYRSNFCFNLTKFFLTKIKQQEFITGESTPTYIHHPLVAKRIAKHLPNVKLIVLLRNPTERAYSHYQMEKRLGYENLEFDEALEKENERLEGKEKRMIEDPNYYSYDWQIHSYRHGGHYAELLQKWFDIFPKKNFLILKTDDFNANPSKIFYQVLDFLNLPKQDVNYNKINVGKYPELNLKIKKDLDEYFKIHNEKLNNLLNRNFGW